MEDHWFYSVYSHGRSAGYEIIPASNTSNQGNNRLPLKGTLSHQAVSRNRHSRPWEGGSTRLPVIIPSTDLHFSRPTTCILICTLPPQRLHGYRRSNKSLTKSFANAFLRREPISSRLLAHQISHHAIEHCRGGLALRSKDRSCVYSSSRPLQQLCGMEKDIPVGRTNVRLTTSRAVQATTPTSLKPASRSFFPSARSASRSTTT